MIPLGVLAGSRHVTPPAGGLIAAYLGAIGTATAATTYSFTSMNLGPESTVRWIVVAFNARAATDVSYVSASVGGATATHLATFYNGSAGNPVIWFMAHVPTGTAGDVVLTLSSGAARAIATAWAITGGVPEYGDGRFSDLNPATLTPTGAADGVTLATSSFGFNATSGPVNWTGVTKRHETTFGSGRASAADAAGNPDVTVNWATPVNASYVNHSAITLTPAT